MGALSWQITNGSLGGVDLSWLAVVLVIWYSDDEPGSPWTWVMHVDERGDPSSALPSRTSSRAVSAAAVSQFRWVFKPSNLLGMVPEPIEIDHTPGRGWFRAGHRSTCASSVRYETESTVTA